MENWLQKGHLKMNAPNGYEELIAMFGNPAEHLDSLGNPTLYWMSNNITLAKFPVPLPLDFDRTQQATKFRCHKKLKDIFEQVFEDIYDEGLWSDMVDWGGCYMHRKKRNGKELSTHAWGIACDIDPSGNPMGSKGIINPKIVEIFKDAGFCWGGDWDYPDPQHFQFAFDY